MKNHLIRTGIAMLLALLCSQSFSQDSLQPTQIPYPGLVPFKAETGWGYMDADGLVYEHPFLDSASLKPLANVFNRAWLTWKKGKVGFVNKRFRVAPQYVSISFNKSPHPRIERWGKRYGLYQTNFSGILLQSFYTRLEHLGAGLFEVQKDANGQKGLIATFGSTGQQGTKQLLPFRYTSFSLSQYKKELRALTSDSLYRYRYTHSVHEYETKITLIEATSLNKPKEPSVPVYADEGEDEVFEYVTPPSQDERNDFADETEIADTPEIPAKPYSKVWHFFFDKKTESDFYKSEAGQSTRAPLIERLQQQQYNTEAYPYYEITEGAFHYLFLKLKTKNYLMVLPASVEVKAVLGHNQLIFDYQGKRRMASAFGKYFKTFLPLVWRMSLSRLSNVNLESKQCFFYQARQTDSPTCQTL
jgi:hypothetical protein